MSNKKTVLKIAIPVAAMFLVGSFFVLKTNTVNRNLGDDALLSLMKNDKDAFVSYIKAGGDVHFVLPKIEGTAYTVAEGTVYFERTSFIEYLQSAKKPFIIQDEKRGFDVLSLSVKKNNPDVLSLLIKENPKMDMKYGDNGWTLLHMASAECSHKIVGLLHRTGKLDWNTHAKDGSTPLTLAAQHDCLPVLSYWKEHGANFDMKDGNGKTALSILKTKKDAALAAFAKSFEPERTVVTVVKRVSVPNFYKKHKFPQDKPVDHSAIIEPEDRPEDAVETADYSEFSD